MKPSSPLPPAVIADAFGWDARNWSAALDFWESLDVVRPGCRALELGCARNGGLSLWLAARGALVTAAFYGDVAPAMAESHARHGVTDRVQYVRGIDARTLPYTEEFDVVSFKSVLGMIPEPDRGVVAAERVFAAAHRALKPGGWLLFVENLVGTPVHAWLRNKYGAGRVGWYYYTADELRRALGPGFVLTDRTAGLLGCLGLSEAQRRVLGSLDRAFVERLVPASWHYIFLGAARKLPAPADPGKSGRP